MMTTEAISPAEVNDAELVAHSLRGDRDAFGQIVARYQALVCSLAYSSSGSLSQSEDLAQETFITAWKNLSGLREPAKLRSWLCIIVRNLSHRARRGQNHEPAHEAEPMETLDKLPAPGPHPLDQAISREEEGILWRSLERIPETYREPLILFYRQHESVEQVSLALELSADTVKQRLVRGRKLLQEEVLAFVEGALGKTSPGPAFTQVVLSALPVAASSAKATAVSATLAAGGAAAKGLATTLGSLGGLFALLGGGFVSARAVADNTKSLRERKFIILMVRIQLGLSSLFLAAIWGSGKFFVGPASFGVNIVRAIIIFIYCTLHVWLSVFRIRRQRQIQIEEKTFDENDWESPKRETDPAVNSSGTRSNSNLKVAKLLAFSLVIAAISIFRRLRNHDFHAAIVVSVIYALILFWAWRRLKNPPRLLNFSGRWFSLLAFRPIVFGSLTLLLFNLGQWGARAHPHRFHISVASPAEVTAFNLIVVLAYALLIGILLRKRDRFKLPM
ncbi:MAG TPA: RNA polymerase sigma factor [Opitutaceae bacterium]|jgi:RNA polymerase sigma factor (sigma-70 family)|nr:RNA polymerase sigma factor [Opitutaceae bacterium]